MLLNGFLALLVAAAAGLGGWLAIQAWRSGHPVVKWGGLALSGLLALVFASVSAVALIGLAKFYTPRAVAVPDLQVTGTDEQIARGRHLANAFCASCHSVTNELPLTGGVDLGQDLPMPLGTFVSANLTPAGPLQAWSDGEIFRAIRNGIDADNQVLFIMSGAQGRNLSDEDIQALIAYLRSQPAVANETQMPLDQPSFLALILLGAGVIPEGPAPTTAVITAPAKAPTAEYGAYILSYQDCTLCHGQDLRGGVEGQLAPIGPSLMVVKGWTLDQFVTTLRTGVDPSGHVLDEKKMPWRNVGRMDDEELEAVYNYLSGLSTTAE